MNDADELNLADLLVVWEEARKKDIHLSVDDLCAKNPHLKPEIQRRVEVLMATGWMNLPVKTKSRGHSETPATASNNQNPWNRYQPGKLVGESRFSRVWCGFDVELHRVIAIKVLKQQRREASGAFLAAARQHALLRHPGIVQIHDIVATEAITFIVLDFVERGSLKNCLSEKGVGFQQAVQWSIQLAEALDFLHRSGITHQNIKPDNILIDKEGKALLTDAGQYHEKGTSSYQHLSPNQTSYLSPEQMSDRTVGIESDIYSLAIVLHEMVTGQLPFARATSDNPAHAPTSNQIDLFASLPPKLAPLLRSCLAANPADRPRSAAVFAEKLKSLLPQNPTRRSMLPVLAGSAVAAAGIFIWVRRNTGLSGAWLRDLFNGTAQQQVELIRQSLMAQNPQFNGEVRGIITNETLTGLDFCTDFISDLHPLSAFKKLKFLKINGTFNTKANGKLNDLAPLRHLPLEHLEISNNSNIRTIAPLQGLHLRHLNINGTSVKELDPLAGSSLKTCIAGMTPITSLSPLADSLVDNLWFNNTVVNDTSFMRGMSLRIVNCYYTPVESLNDLEGQPVVSLNCASSSVQIIEPLTYMTTIQALNISGTRVVNIKPLLTLNNLKYLWFDFNLERDGEVIRNLRQLERLNNMSPADAIKESENKP